MERIRVRFRLGHHVLGDCTEFQYSQGPVGCQPQQNLVLQHILLWLLFFRKATDIEWRYDKDGERIRVSVRTGRIIPLPPGKDMGDDLVVPEYYVGE